MSADFWSYRFVGAIRKPRRCAHCCTKMASGEPADRYAGMWEGDFFAQYYHPECTAAADALTKLIGTWGEGEYDDLPGFLHEMPDQYWPWLFNHHPVAAEYLNRARFIAETERREAA